MTIWLVRAGGDGEREDFALDKGYAVIGWEEIDENLSKLKSRDDVISKLKEIYEEKDRTIQNWANQIWGFVDGIKKGDLIVLPSKIKSTIAVGEAVGPYEYRKEHPKSARHCRKVKWINKDIPRNNFDQDLLYSMGAFLTVCKITRNNAEERIKAVVYGKKAKQIQPELEEAELIDLEQYASDQIQKFILKNFKGHDFTKLIAAILQAKGYKIHVSPEGPDGGVDILAGTGPLGFDEPKIAVQVKSGTNPIDVDVLRSLQGVLRTFGANNGLLISWSGFKQSVYREARKCFFEVRLWDARDIVRELQANYEKLSDSIQASLPLKRIWSLVEREA